MTYSFHLVDSLLVFVYFIAMLLIGLWFFLKKNETVEEFSVADRSLTAFPLGLSLFASYVSSIGFFAIPAQAFESNWSFLAFDLPFPIAAFITIKYFIPFCRSNNDICVYTQLYRRFGRWASVYSSTCFCITQILYIATILYLLSTFISLIFELNGNLTIIITGGIVITYTCIGGIKAVIYSDIIQTFLLILGTIICAVIIIVKSPSMPEIISKAIGHSKFNLGDFKFNLSSPNFWVCFISGTLGHLTTLTVTQGMVQRYYSAKSDKDAKNSVIILTALIIPCTILFLFIGTELFSFYSSSENILPQKILDLGSDSTLPHFIFSETPSILKGFLLVCILAAGMSSIDTSINATTTTIYSEICKPLLRKYTYKINEMTLLYSISLIVGVIAILGSMILAPCGSILDVWIPMAFLFNGGMFGLFLLGVLSRRTKNFHAMLATIIGTILLIWIGLTDYFSNIPDYLKSPVHSYLNELCITITVVLSGFLLTAIFAKKSNSP